MSVQEFNTKYIELKQIIPKINNFTDFFDSIRDFISETYNRELRIFDTKTAINEANYIIQQGCSFVCQRVNKHNLKMRISSICLFQKSSERAGSLAHNHASINFQSHFSKEEKDNELLVFCTQPEIAALLFLSQSLICSNLLFFNIVNSLKIWLPECTRFSIKINKFETIFKKIDNQFENLKNLSLYIVIRSDVGCSFVVDAFENFIQKNSKLKTNFQLIDKRNLRYLHQNQQIDYFTIRINSNNIFTFAYDNGSIDEKKSRQKNN